MTLTSGPATSPPMSRTLEAACARLQHETGIALSRSPHLDMLRSLLNHDEHVVDLVAIMVELDAGPAPATPNPITPRGQVAVGFAALAVGRLPRMIVSWQTGTLRVRYGGLIVPVPEISHILPARFTYRGQDIDGFDVGSRLMLLLRDGEGLPIPRLPILFSPEQPDAVVARWRSALGTFLTQRPLPHGTSIPDQGRSRPSRPVPPPHRQGPPASQPFPAAPGPTPAPGNPAPRAAAPGAPAAPQRPTPTPTPAATPERGTEMLDTLKPKHRKLLEDELLAGEQILAVVNLRENQAIALTGHRVIVVNGSLIFRGANVMPLADIATVSSGALAIGLGLRNGGECEFSFWPSGTNRSAAQTFVRKLREAQMAPALSAPSSQAAPSVADELMKLGRLREQGLLTDQEFANQKASLLG